MGSILCRCIARSGAWREALVQLVSRRPSSVDRGDPSLAGLGRVDHALVGPSSAVVGMVDRGVPSLAGPGRVSHASAGPSLVTA